MRVKKVCKNCMSWKKGECDCPKFVYSMNVNKTPTDGLEYGDAEGYDAYFKTGPEFGCIHFTR